MPNILDRIQAVAYLRDREVPGAKEALAGAIERLKRQNPFRLKAPPAKKFDLVNYSEE